MVGLSLLMVLIMMEPRLAKKTKNQALRILFFIGCPLSRQAEWLLLLATVTPIGKVI